MSKKILDISEKFLQETNLEPHLNCIIATQRLLLLLRENNIPAEWVIYFVDVPYFNGQKPKAWSEVDCLEHHCIRIDNQILDVTASQFNDQNGQTMPRIFFGQLPNFYLEN